MRHRFEVIVKELLKPLQTAEGAPVSVLVAVSGGPDSMALAELFFESGLPFGIAHCNFHLRGKEGDEDTVMVRRWARLHKVRFHRADFDTVAIASKRGISVEMAARELRYRFFGQTARRFSYQAVAVAHHREDNAETLILNLLRGTGARGLSGMRPYAPLPVKGYEDIPVIRPLLSYSRDSIFSLIARENIPYRLDHSNSENTYKRNRIRNQVFPIFKELNPSFVTTLNEDAQRVAIVGDIAEDYYREHRDKVLRDNAIDIDALTETPHWEYLLYRILMDYGFAPGDASMAEDLIKSHAHLSGKTLAGGDKVLIFAYGQILITEPRDFWEDFHSMRIEAPGEYRIGDVGLRVSLEEWSGEADPREVPTGQLLLDAASLPFPFTARNWKRGDYMRPLGLKGRKKLQDLFTDLHYSLEQKHDAILLEADNFPHGNKDSAYRTHVAVLMPLRIDERVRITEKTQTVLRLQLI